jgi:HopJ type III effector protein
MSADDDTVYRGTRGKDCAASVVRKYGTGEVFLKNNNERSGAVSNDQIRGTSDSGRISRWNDHGHLQRRRRLVILGGYVILIGGGSMGHVHAAESIASRLTKENFMSDLGRFLSSVDSGDHLFAGTLSFIATYYNYQPQAFRNGDMENAAGENEGSCKTLGLAKLEGLNDRQALMAFGEYYRGVLANPEGTDHANIRNLILYGLAGVSFDHQPLARKM